MPLIPHFNQWDIVIAYVRFADTPTKGKSRPVLIYSMDNGFATTLKITSKHSPLPSLVIPNWQELGLLKESWLQLEPFYQIGYHDFGPVIGHADQAFVNKLLSLLRS